MSDERAAPTVDGLTPGLFVDLYELTMAQAYVADGMTGRATFSLFVRDLPPERRFLLAAGLDAALAWLEGLRFTDADVEYLARATPLSRDFLDWLRDFRFSGDVRAIPEGTPVFADEPLLEVDAPLPGAQIVETVLLNQVTYATLVASKGARVVLAAGGRPVIDFGTRRTHGTDAALAAARALYLAGFDGTSNVEAGRRYGIPVTGTMAHAYVQAHDDEAAAFRAFARHFPETTLLVDTYDTLQGVRHVVDLARELGRLGEEFRVRAIRLDSGDIVALAREARRILDDGGLEGVRILASGGLDEYAVARFRAEGTPIDGYAVGTRVNVSRDAPALETAYKLVAYEGVGRRKLSTDKETLPYPKQVYRRFEGGVMAGDVIARADESLDAKPLLVPVMRAGRRLPEGEPDLDAARRRAASGLAALPEDLRSLERGGPAYPVDLSPALRAEVSR